MDYSKFNRDSLRALAGYTSQREVDPASLRNALSKRGGAIQGKFEGESRQVWLQDYNASLHSCIAAADQIEQLRPEYKKQSIILESYYQRDKLLDYLEQLTVFSQAEPRPADTGEKLAVKGYSNYLFVIRCTLRAMEDNLAEHKMQLPKESLSARMFLKQESTGEPVLEQWQKLFQKIAQTLKSPSVVYKEYAVLLQELDELEVSFQRSYKAAAAFLAEKEQVLVQRRVKMEEEIRIANALHNALSQLFTEELFERFDPDIDDEWSLDVAQTKQAYRELAQRIQQILEEFPRR